eukprot:13896-Heterococcus_DN1.PRE.1
MPAITVQDTRVFRVSHNCRCVQASALSEVATIAIAVTEAIKLLDLAAHRSHHLYNNPVHAATASYCKLLTVHATLAL